MLSQLPEATVNHEGKHVLLAMRSSRFQAIKHTLHSPTLPCLPTTE
jgi:hypothetical protein